MGNQTMHYIQVPILTPPPSTYDPLTSVCCQQFRRDEHSTNPVTNLPLTVTGPRGSLINCKKQKYIHQHTACFVIMRLIFNSKKRMQSCG